MMEDAINKFEKPSFKATAKAKVKEWINRFLPAEIVGTILALSASYTTRHFTHNALLAAYAGAIGETTGFYLVVFIQSYRALCRQLQIEEQQLSAIKIWQVFRNILLDYGLAEIVDSLFLRPFCMYIFPKLISNYALGIFIGKLVSDICFYIPVIVSYELRLLWAKRRP